ncbi:polyprenyl synthetase family protein [Fundidesulfovibrio butyratiphilus]
MSELRLYIAEELPHVEACLRRHVMALPSTVRPVALHVLEAGGKRLRPMLLLLTARALGYGAPDIYPLACSLEFLHSATLLHDDILDDADLRRGRPTAHTLFGATRTILAGDALLALGNSLAANYGLASITACLSEGILNTVSGEIAEIDRVRDVTLTHNEYLDIIVGKTACLIQTACRCGALLAQAPDELCRDAAGYGLNLGVAFQLADDALDYSSAREVSGKPRGGDLREGKLTLPLLAYIETLTGEEKERFTSSFKENTLASTQIDAIVERIVREGHTTSTRELASHYLNKARACLSGFPKVRETSLLAEALEGMADRNT